MLFRNRKLFQLLISHNIKISVLLLLIGLAGCATKSPLNEFNRVSATSSSINSPGVSVTFLGNTTLYISDGEENILIDGFLSRPSIFKTFTGRLKSDKGQILKHLDLERMKALDAILVTHTHHDHALDAPAISTMCVRCKAYGSESYGNLHRAMLANDESTLGWSDNKSKTIPGFQNFTVTFFKASHVKVRPTKIFHRIAQRAIKGKIATLTSAPNRYSDFKMGEVFGLAIEHPHGNILVSTSAGPLHGMPDGFDADIAFVSVGLLNESSKIDLKDYWGTIVQANPETIVPIHWDNFSKSAENLTPPPWYASNPRAAMRNLANKSDEENIQFRIIDYNQTIVLNNGNLK